MAWQLKVWASGVSPLTGPSYTYSNTAPGGIQGGFQFELEPNGNCVQMVFEGMGNQLSITATNSVQLLINGVPMFYGYVSSAPSSSDKFRKPFSVLGYKDRISKTPTIQLKAIGITPLEQLITQTGTPFFGYYLNLPAAVTYDSTLIQTSIGSTPNWNYSFVPLGQALNRISELATARVEWGVGADTKFFFRVPPNPAPITLAYPVSNLEFTAVLEDNVVTSAIVPLRRDNPSFEFTAIAPIRPFTSKVASPASGNFIGAAFAYIKNLASHSIYDRAKILEVGNIPLFAYRLAYDASFPFNFNNPNNAIDNDPTTYASNVGGGAGGSSGLQFESTNANSLNVYGFEVEYSTDSNLGTNSITALINYGTGVSAIHTQTQFDLPPTGTHANQNKIRAVMKFDGTATTDRATIQIYLGTSTVTDSTRIYAMRMLEITPLIPNVCDDYLRDPQLTAARAKPNLMLSPTPTASITDTPQGTITAPAMKYTYNYSNDETSTTIDLGNRVDDPTARVLRNAASITDAQNRADTRKLGGF